LELQLLDSLSPKAAFIFADYFNHALASDDGKVAVQPSDQPYIDDLEKRQGFIQWCGTNQRKLFDEVDGLPKMRHTPKQMFQIQLALLKIYRYNICCHTGTQQNV
jgi:hypothetical protein